MRGKAAMYVCVCHAVSDRQIRECVDQGARSLFEVQCQLPVGSCCGRCQDTASQVVSEHIQSRTQRQAA
jgi:bacterioferritin-associated ferredoxin